MRRNNSPADDGYGYYHWNEGRVAVLLGDDDLETAEIGDFTVHALSHLYHNRYFLRGCISQEDFLPARIEMC